jgi:hypothetical protein
MRRVFILLAVTVVAAICWGQQQLIPDKGFDRADGETSSGTLNLILANRNGFVIAPTADERLVTVNTGTTVKNSSESASVRH